MKKYILKNISGKLAAFCMTGSILLASCQANFESINTDKDKIKTEDLDKDNLRAAFIQSMQLTVISEDPNTYQVVDDIHSNVYSGYMGQASAWNNGMNSTSYWFDVSLKWQDRAFMAAYGSIQTTDGKPIPGIMNSWRKMTVNMDKNSITYAIGEVVKVAGMHRITDTYGPIPYTQYTGQLYPPYDSQEVVYSKFFEELNHAIGIMTDYYTANSAAKPIIEFDLIYKSDILKWIKFANSLKLRLAMRIKYVDPANARKFAEEAVNHTYGVIEDITGTAKISSSSGPYAFVNPMYQLWNIYAEERMGANMESFLNGYNDPRRSKYFSPLSNGTYRGMRAGMPTAGNYKTVVSTPNINTNSPLYWLQAAEVYFLRAEGALEGWNMNGSASDLYNKGIEVAMSEWGVIGSAVSDYINDATSKPAEYKDPRGASSYNVLNGNPMLSTITIKWNDGAMKEQNLERIITQKWLAMYPNGMEAWSEFRRTGYPKIFTPAKNTNTAQIPDGQYIKRLPLPVSEYDGNEVNVKEAVAKYLDGNDSPGTKLWWDAK